MSVMIWIDGPMCIGKTTVSLGLLELFHGFDTKYLDSDYYHEQYKLQCLKTVRQKQDESTKGFIEYIKMARLSFCDDEFIEFFKRTIQAEEARHDIIIVSMTLGTNIAKTQLYDLFSGSAQFIHIILDMEEALVLQRIEQSDREDSQKSWAKRTLYSVRVYLQENYKSDVWINVYGKTISEIISEIIGYLPVSY